AAEPCLDFARRRAGAALEAVALHGRAAADVAFGHRSGLRAVERGEDVLRLDVKAVDVVEVAVVGFRDDRQQPRLRVLLALDRPLDRRVADDADAVRVGDEDRPLEKPGLFDPGRAGHLAVAVHREPAGEHLILRRLAARQDGGDAGTNRPAPDLQRPVAGDERGDADLDAGNVGNRVERPRRAVKRDAEIARAGLALRARFRGYERGRYRKTENRGEVLEPHRAASGDGDHEVTKTRRYTKKEIYLLSRRGRTRSRAPGRGSRPGCRRRRSASCRAQSWSALCRSLRVWRRAPWQSRSSGGWWRGRTRRDARRA